MGASLPTAYFFHFSHMTIYIYTYLYHFLRWQKRNEKSVTTCGHYRTSRKLENFQENKNYLLSHLLKMPTINRHLEPFLGFPYIYNFLISKIFSAESVKHDFENPKHFCMYEYIIPCFIT